MTLGVPASCRAGDAAPDFHLTGGDLGVVNLDAALGNGANAAMFIVVPSLDTNVCSLESKKFNTRISELPADVKAFVVSMDLPFAMGRWCGAEGDITGSKTALAWSQNNAGNYMQTPLLDNGLGYFCFDNGILTVYQLSTGEKLYQQRLGGGTSGFSSSAVAGKDRLYITNEDGHTYVLAKGGTYKLLGENELGETVMASPAISSDVLYLRGRNHLFAIAAK